MNVKRRLRKLEARYAVDLIPVKLQNGGTATLHSERLFDIFFDVLRGNNTQEARIALQAVSWSGDAELIALMQAVDKGKKLMEKKHGD